MPIEPTVKRALVYFDGQNPFHGAREAFGYTYPNYDPMRLARQVCVQRDWSLHEVHFYTGIPDATDDPFWNHFWMAKLAHMGRQGIRVFSRPLRYRNQVVRRPDGSAQAILVRQEKGVDIRIALDIVRAVRVNECDVALVFSQDQDLSEVADEIRTIAREQDRWMKIASAFPDSPALRNHRGVNKTDWVRIDRQTYDQCLDPNDYRPKKGASP
jgi:uncharacterized LabA/DUF88 family protein